MNRYKEFVVSVLGAAGISIENPEVIRIKNEQFYERVIRTGSLGLGESYMDGWWDCPRLDELFYRLLSAHIDEKVKAKFSGLIKLLPSFVNLQSRSRAKMVAESHYDLDSDLFISFLDPYNQYSCAYFDGTEDLAEAQLKKMDLICRKINISRDDHVLDIGCGWGGFAKYLAEKHGCRVTAVNISRNQISYAKELCRGLPVRVLRCDYRDLSGSFDKIVSIGMFEHVGQKNYGIFMKTIHRCLRDNGIFLLHTIGGNESRINCDPWINKYIFPNGMLPSVAQVGKAIEGLFLVEDFHNLAPHYEKTLMAWQRNFQEAWPKLSGRYDQRFKRMWEYYLLSCAGAFRARDIQVWQFVLTKYNSPRSCCDRFGR